MRILLLSLSLLVAASMLSGCPGNGKLPYQNTVTPSPTATR